MTFPADNNHSVPLIDLPGRAGAVPTALLLEELPPQLFLNYYQGARRVMAVVEPLSFDAGSGTLTASWPSEASNDYQPPEAGDPAVASLHVHGMLHLIDAVVIERGAGGQGGLVLELAPVADSFNQRRNPRFNLQAQVQLEAEEGGASYTSEGSVRVNVSLGGFGLTIPEPETWQARGTVRFVLELEASHGSAALPGIRLEGKAAVRRVLPLSGDGVHVGCEFTELSDYRASVLKYWLDSFSVYLREG
jgi:hypothetical protein